MDSFARSVLSYSRFLAACMSPLGVAQKPRYRTDSDSGVMGRGLLLYVKSYMIALLASMPSTVICFIFIMFTGIPLHSSNSCIAFISVCIPFAILRQQCHIIDKEDVVEWMCDR